MRPLSRYNVFSDSADLLLYSPFLFSVLQLQEKFAIFVLPSDSQGGKVEEEYSLMTMITLPLRVSEDEIKHNLSAYLRRVQAGETLIIVTAGKPLVEIRPLEAISQPKRPIGLGAGEFTVPDDFDAPLPENVVQEFEA